jgi:UPF0755 protein
MRYINLFVFCSTALIVFVCVACGYMVYGKGPLDSPSSVVIDKGLGSSAVGNILQSNGVIKYPLLFKLLSRFYQLDKKLKAGEYEFAAHDSLFMVIKKISQGEVIYRKITLPEGLTTKQMMDIISSEEMLSGEITILAKEGELLPETYTFVRGDSKDSIIEQAKQAMVKVLKQSWETRDSNIPIRNAQELLTLASIVEKETGLESERTMVASVFVNRLRKGMKLQTDPTVIYALTNGQKELGRNLLKKDLLIDNPYNTYVYYGLPPTPICNPGKKAIEAAANPDISDYLYFVATGSGGHNFASSLQQHNHNVSNYRKNKK